MRNELLAMVKETADTINAFTPDEKKTFYFMVEQLESMMRIDERILMTAISHTSIIKISLAILERVKNG